MKAGRLTHVARVRGVDVYVHWTVLLIVAIILLSAPRGLATTLTGLTSYLALLLLHEAGHLMVARRLRYDTFSIAIYPIFGLASMERPVSRLDRALIAWGGVTAQATVAIPLVLATATLGYTPFQPLNAVLAILGSYSLFVAAFNLLPVRPLDGSMAWQLLPAYLEERAARKRRRAMPYRSAR